jgi:hypothetical protein
LGIFQRAAAFKVSCNSRGAECVAADPALQAELGRAALNHAPGVDAVHHGTRYVNLNPRIGSSPGSPLV